MKNKKPAYHEEAVMIFFNKPDLFDSIHTFWYFNISGHYNDKIFCFIVVTYDFSSGVQ